MSDSATQPIRRIDPAATAAPVLVIGDCQSRWVRERFQGVTQVVFEPSGEVALARLVDGEIVPAVVVVVQLRRNSFSSALLEQIHSAAPLAPKVAFLGSWCEGETRSGHPLPGMQRWYWHQFPRRLTRLLADIDLRPAAGAHGARTWTKADEGLMAGSTTRPPTSGWIGVRAIEPNLQEALLDGCHACGFAACGMDLAQLRQSTGLSAVLWAGDLTRPNQIAELQKIRAATGGCPIVCVLSFPRRRDVELALSLGATDVLAQPFDLEELALVLSERVSKSSTTVPS